MTERTNLQKSPIKTGDLDSLLLILLLHLHHIFTSVNYQIVLSDIAGENED